MNTLIVYRFLIKHYRIKISYKTGLFQTAWNLNNMIEYKKRKAYKI